MPRFGLQAIGPIDYRSSLPQYDPNNAIWPRISAFAKMLHDISWEDEDEYDDGTGRTDEERNADFEQNARENVKTSEDRKMDGYSEYLDDQSLLTEDEKKTQAAEQQLEDERNRRNTGFSGDRSGGMDRQRQLAEAAMQEDPDTVARHQSELIDELADVNANAKTRIPSEDGNGYYQMGPDYVKHYQEIVGTSADGDWGKASKRALENYLKQRGY